MLDNEAVPSPPDVPPELAAGAPARDRVRHAYRHDMGPRERSAPAHPRRRRWAA